MRFGRHLFSAPQIGPDISINQKLNPSCWTIVKQIILTHRWNGETMLMNYFNNYIAHMARYSPPKINLHLQKFWWILHKITSLTSSTFLARQPASGTKATTKINYMSARDGFNCCSKVKYSWMLMTKRSTRATPNNNKKMGLSMVQKVDESINTHSPHPRKKNLLFIFY